MTELDQIWSQMLDQAAIKARERGSHDVAKYLQLKATNDAIRSAGVGWLFDSVIEIASITNGHRPTVSIERDDPHSFRHGSSNIVGAVVRVRQGVRCLTVEAGWTRTPADGIMRGGALAIARIIHFGMTRSNAELMLVADADLPFWRVSETRSKLDSDELRRHFELLMS